MAETRLIQLQGSEGPVVFEATVHEGGGSFEAEGLPSVDDLWEQVRRFASGARTVIAAVSPSSFTVEVSAGLEGEAGWVLAKASVNATVTISLTWEKPAPA